MKNAIRLLLAASTLAILTACGNNNSVTSADATSSASSATANVQLAQSVDSYRPPASAVPQESPMKPRDLSAAPTAANIALGAPLASQTAAVRKNNATPAEDHMGKPLQIGFGRDVAQTATSAATNQVLKWQATPSGGQVAAINFTSTGAKGIRIGLLVTKLPETATLRFYAKGAATAFEVKGAEVLAVLAKNLAAGDKTDDGRTYWGPSVDGVDATLEIEIPAGESSSSVSVSVPSISHIFMSNKEISTVAAQLTYTGDTNLGLTCQVDVTCTSPAPIATDAVAHLRYNKAGIAGTFICSGTLLNDNINSVTPYVLTANHCISTQTVASTLEVWFKYRSTTCNNGTTGEYYPTYGGGDLLYTAYGTDSTLFKLRNPPTASGLLYAGWDSTTPPAISTAIHSIHHPRGDQQRLSRGSVTGYFTRNPTVTDSFPGSNVTSGTILGVTLTTGLTEGGSSGSGLFKGTDANPIVIGQLFGGSTPGNIINPTNLADPRNYVPACTVGNPLVAMPPNNVYGRFDVAYNKGMSDHLTQGVKGVNRFYNNQSGTHFYTISAYEKDYLQTGFPTIYNYEGAPFKASTITAAGLSPVHRFYNLNLGVYFYTISEPERAFVVANLPQMRYEGIAWYANPTSIVGTIPLYRFYNRDKGVHFFTSSAAERASVIANLPQMNDEGIAYYVLP